MNRNWREFIHNALTIILGSGFAQVVIIAISPILTRMFSPEDFGLLALYGAIVSVLTTIATLRYEQTIVLPNDEKEANALVLLSLLITFGLTIFSFCLIYAFELEIVALLGTPSIASFLYLLPLSLLGNGIYQTGSYLAIRKQQFKQISKAQVAQSCVTASSQISMGMLSMTGGLILGQFLGLLSACAVFWKTLKGVFISQTKVSRKDLFSAASEYKSYPTFSLLGALSNSVSAQLPIFVMVRYFSEAIVGIYALAYRIVTLPVSILGQGVSQVFLQRISTLQYTQPAKIYGEVLKMSFVLFMLLLPVAVVKWFWGETLFAIVFGEAWREAGRVAGLLVIAVIFRFPVSALSGVLVLKKTLKLGVAWQLIYLLTLSITLWCLQTYSFDTFVMIFVLHEVLLSLIYLWFILRGAKHLKDYDSGI